MKSCVLALGWITMCLSCLLSCTKEHAPSRPSNVPRDTVWAGGPDGGCWVKCTIDERHDVNRCVAYLDTTGTIMQSGTYRLRGLKRAARAEELSYSWCDGRLIGLRRQLVLEPI
jgi:hypothetical protein